MSKPNCYKCTHRESLKYSAHSRCNAVTKENTMEDIFAYVVASDNRNHPDVRVKGNLTGINNGWFNWPIDFDPVWVDECKFFQEKEQNNDRV